MQITDGRIMSDKGAEDRGRGLPVAIRAKQALAIFGATNSGLAALQEFVFPTLAGMGVTGAFDSSDRLGMGWLSIAPRDFNYENINTYNSSIVMACINWIVGGFREAIPSVSRLNADGVETALPNHRFINFLTHPNPYYNLTKLLPATLISYYLDGNAYWFKERSDGGLGQTRAVYYIPHYQIIPKAKETGDYISHYDYTVNGVTYAIPRERIIHFRHELCPYNPLSGRKILHPVLSEIYTDEEAARFIAALIRNTAIPGVIITPDTKEVEVTKGDADALKETYKRKFGGDNRGEVMVMNFAAKIAQMGFNPEQLQFKETRRLPEERVAAQFRIAPVVAGLGAGLDKSTYNNYEQAERHSYQGALIPAWIEIGEELETQLFYEFTGGDTSYKFRFDYSNIQALSESKNEKVSRVRGLWLTDLILRSEARAELGLEVEDARDTLFFSETKPKTGLPVPVKALLERYDKPALLLMAGSREDNLNSALDMGLESDIKDASGEMAGDLDPLYADMGKEAQKEATQALDKFSPVSEAERITANIFKALGIAMLLKAIWGKMGRGLTNATVESISLRLGVSIESFWDEDAQALGKATLVGQSNSYENALREQTKRAIQIAIQGAQEGQSVAQIAKSIKQNVSGREMYPGVFKEGYDNAKGAGATEEEALRAGESKARRYRAKLIAETETRNYQNLTSLESYQKAGLDKVKVTDGDGCGWKTHNDTDKAHNTVRAVSDARRHTLAHPQCKRRFHPVTK